MVKRRKTKKKNNLKKINKEYKELSNGDLDQILDDIKSDKGIVTTNVPNLNKSLMSRGKPHPSMKIVLKKG